MQSTTTSDTVQRPAVVGVVRHGDSAAVCVGVGEEGAGVEALIVHERLAMSSRVHLVKAAALLALRAKRAGRFSVGGSGREEGGVACAVGSGAGGRGVVRRVVIFDGFVTAGKKADFAKDADVAARAAGGALGGHFGVAVGGRVIRILALATPEEKDGQCQKGEEGENADDDSCDGASGDGGWG